MAMANPACSLCSLYRVDVNESDRHRRSLLSSWLSSAVNLISWIARSPSPPPFQGRALYCYRCDVVDGFRGGTNLSALHPLHEPARLCPPPLVVPFRF